MCTQGDHYENTKVEIRAMLLQAKECQTASKPPEASREAENRFFSQPSKWTNAVHPLILNFELIQRDNTFLPCKPSILRYPFMIQPLLSSLDSSHSVTSHCICYNLDIKYFILLALSYFQIHINTLPAVLLEIPSVPSVLTYPQPKSQLWLSLGQLLWQNLLVPLIPLCQQNRDFVETGVAQLVILTSLVSLKLWMAMWLSPGQWVTNRSWSGGDSRT